MSPHRRKIDLFFLVCITLLSVVGFFIFLSASLGLISQNGASFSTVAIKQSIGLIIGIIAFIIFSKINYTILKKLSLFILIGAIAVNCLLFIPSLALHVNGASRWISLGPLSFQPSELLKIAFIIYIAAWASFVKDKISNIRLGLIPYAILTAILSLLLLAQRDTDTLLIIAITGLIMMLVAGLPFRHVAIAFGLLGLLVLSVLFMRPYALERVKTFFNRSADTQGSGYQINQSLIAIGSGQISGRGFGQSIQKFGYLPQPTDDSIFAVEAEEFGFVGSTILILIYMALTTSIFRIANRSQDTFGGLLAVGIGSLIVIESFMNIAAMLGLLPLSGVPLLFVSHGGTALIISLIVAGIVANISKYHR